LINPRHNPFVSRDRKRGTENASPEVEGKDTRMKRLSSMLVMAAVLLALLPASLALANAPSQSTTTHTPGTGFVYPYLEVWEGPIEGDIDGWIEWWIDVETWTAWPYIVALEPPPNASHYTMVVKIYDSEGGTLILETLEHGTTTMANTTWRANGTVTYADETVFPGWEGRRVHESGTFTMGPTGPVEGTSIFRIN
jgi:hypothetical protein